MAKIEEIRNKLKSRQEISELRKEYASLGKKVVFTNGCFDILHKGHILYLSEASELGDILVIGINSDSSVKRLKGASRPVNKENDRALVVAALGFVDNVVIFSEDTPYNLIKLLEPDILVKGGDWQIADIVGNDIVTAKGGKVLSLRYVEGYSTTGVLARMGEE
jgi:D-glycero-beta-D-manno-heptose 1-phosphate adenylyltransferase